MKKLVTIIVLAFMLSNATAQKIIIKTVDKFTGDRILETSVVKINDPYVDFKIRCVNDSLFLQASLYNIRDVIEIDKNVSISLLTRNGEIITLTGSILNSNIKEKNNSIYWGAGISTGNTKKITNIDVQFQLPDDKLELLQESDITDIRINICHKNIDHSTERITQKRLSKLFNLIQ